MSQLSAARQPLNPPASPSADIDELPPYLRRHVQVGFNHDDITALLSSIESSQAASSSATRLALLPTEILLHILEYVPVDHLLDWRLVCRGFRDAIDGQVLYRQLRRTKLVGYMGPRHERPMDTLSDTEYEKIHLVHARFQRVEKSPEQETATGPRATNTPVWSHKYAVFSIDDAWYSDFHRIGGAAARQGDTIEDADAQWMITLDQLELCRPEDGFGTLRWCIWLDDAVLDLDFPVEDGRMHFDVDVNLNQRRIRVAWKDMLFRFLKTERALRMLLDEVCAAQKFHTTGEPNG